MLDFTHVDDVVRGVLAVIEQLAGNTRTLLPVHLVTGTGIRLGELAELAKAAGGRSAKILEAPSRAYDVTHFVGDPSRARALLGWRAQIDIAEGVARLVRDFVSEAGLVETPTEAEALQKTSSPA
jgi:nucleoside-diphosphate-sugar epimerase